MQVIANSSYTFTVSEIHERENIYIFSGEENYLRLTRNLDTDFICKYYMAMYPFDTQTCLMQYLLPIVENDFGFLKNDGLLYAGKIIHYKIFKILQTLQNFQKFTEFSKIYKVFKV